MKRRRILGLAVALFITSSSAVAHHGFSGVFDQNKVLTLKGAVTKVDWMNPHPYVYIDVKDINESLTGNWSVELPDLNKLKRYGLEKDMFEIGKEITVDAYSARVDGDFGYLTGANLPAGHAKAQRFARAKEVLFANGKRIQTPG